MDESVLVLFVVFGTFAAVQVALAYGLARASRGQSDESGPTTALDAEQSADVAEAGGVRCSYCGATNDPAYTFCRVCVRELAGGGGGSDGESAAWSRGA